MGGDYRWASSINGKNADSRPKTATSPWPAPVIAGTSAVLVLVIALLDHATGPEIGFSIFYLIPIIIASWVGGFSYGTLISLLSAAAWLYVEKLTVTYSSPLVPYWNATIRLIFFLGFAYLLAQRKSASRVAEETRKELEIRVVERTADLQEAVQRLNHELAEHKRTEESRARLAMAVDQSAESIVITDTEANIVYVNPSFERTSGYTREEVLGKNPRILKSGRQPAEFYRAMWESLARGEAWSGRMSNRAKDGKLYEEEATIAPVHDEKGQLVNYVAVKRDVTREFQLEEQLRQSQKMEAIGRLAGGVAHDFNNLLTIINGYSQLVLEDLEPQNPSRVQVEEISKAGERAAALTRQLLAFSRRQVLQPQVLNLNAAVSNMGKMLKRLIGEDIELDVHLEDPLHQVKADPGQIEQVLMNLVVNARDAMPAGGKLTIETSNVELDSAYSQTHATVVPGSYVMIAVTDSGTGMDDATRAHVFEPFFTTKPKGKGTGLGLATVYGIIKQSGGYIWLYSERGHGTTFKIYFPVSEGNVQPTTSRTPKRVDIEGNETILLVEDQEEVRTLAQLMLETKGYTVLSAAGPLKALHIVSQRKDCIHLLLTDVVMPAMNGTELAQKLIALCPEMKVVYMSGYTDDSVVRHGMLGIGMYYIQKPFTPEGLVGKVREALGPRNPSKSS
jgi:PAS domain S-box-containing protein